MSDHLSYEVAVVGGGLAGMTTALYTTRLGHRTAVVEETGGRHTAASHVHNLYGVSGDVSGRELSKHAAEQFVEYGGDYYPDTVNAVRRRADGRFVVAGEDTTVEAERVVFATGFTDRTLRSPACDGSLVAGSTTACTVTPTSSAAGGCSSWDTTTAPRPTR